eukprot:767480-Hanusia_phi.AAC.5
MNEKDGCACKLIGNPRGHFRRRRGRSRDIRTDMKGKEKSQGRERCVKTARESRTAYHLIRKVLSWIDSIQLGVTEGISGNLEHPFQTSLKQAPV